MEKVTVKEMIISLGRFYTSDGQEKLWSDGKALIGGIRARPKNTKQYHIPKGSAASLFDYLEVDYAGQSE